MVSSVIQIVLYVLAACVFGAGIGWSIQGAIGKRRIDRLTGESKAKFDEVTRQKDQFASAYAKSRTTVESLRAAYSRGTAELESALEKSKSLAKNVLALRAEREETKKKIGTLQYTLASIKKQTTALQAEFGKTREFYKRELAKSFEKRKLLERNIEIAREEQEAFAHLVEKSISEHGSADQMIAAAQLRFGQLEVLERNVSKLEAENEHLREDAMRMKREYQAVEREIAELDELRINNKQLVRCVEALENSRKEYETDAERYRSQADQSEQLSETLRLKLDDLERNFADIEKQQHQTLQDARKAAVIPMVKRQR